LTDKGKDSVGIIIKAPFTGSYFCAADNIKLHLQDKETGEYICPKCYESYFPTLEKVKKGNKFETPAGRDHVSLVSLVKDTNTEPSSVYHKPKLPPSLQQMLNRPGVFLTHYETSED
jgi:hypothetical protein